MTTFNVWKPFGLELLENIYSYTEYEINFILYFEILYEIYQYKVL